MPLSNGNALDSSRQRERIQNLRRVQEHMICREAPFVSVDSFKKLLKILTEKGKKQKDSNWKRQDQDRKAETWRYAGKKFSFTGKKELNISRGDKELEEEGLEGKERGANEWLQDPERC